MTPHHGLHRPVRAATCAAVFLALVSLSISAGCTDHRMSLDEFIALQKELESQAAPAPAPAEMAGIARQLGPYRLGQEDVISVAVSSGDAKVTLPLTEMRITSGGTVPLPLVGQVKVAGLTLQEAEDAIHKAYVPQYMSEALVYVRLVEAEATSVVVLGAGAPRLVSLTRTNRDLLHALGTAFGVTGSTADRTDAEVFSGLSGRVSLRRVREPGRVLTYDLREPEDLRAVMSLEPLENGDIISIDTAQPNRLFVGGLVLAPGTQEFPPGAHPTVLQAIAGAGGLNQYVFPREGLLVRRVNGQDTHVKLDLVKIAQADAPNIELMPGDILWVPHTTRTRILEFINSAVFFRAGSTATYRVAGSDLYGDEKGTDSTTIFAP